MYEGDTPNAERRAAALALDRDLLRELLGQEELRELIDPEALEEVEAQLQHRTEAGLAEDRDALQQILRRLGDLTAEECEQRVDGGLLGRLDAGEAGRRAARRLVRIDGEERYIAAEDAGLYRDALGVPPPAGLPESFLEDHPRRDARPRAPLRAHPRALPDRASWRTATGWIRRRRCASSSARATWSAASCFRAAPSASGATPTCCAGSAEPASPTCAEEVEPADRATLRPLPAELAERRCPPRRRRRAGPPARGAGPAAGRRAHAEGLGARRAAAPPRRLLARPGSTSSAPAARSSGSAPGRSAATTAGSPSTSARTSAWPARRPATPRSSGPRASPRRDPRAPGRRARASGSTCSPTSRARRGAPRRALGPGLGGGGDQRRLRAAAGAAAARRPSAANAGGAASPAAVPAPAGTVQGRWSLTAPLFEDAPRRPAVPRPGRADARALRDRHPRDGARRGRPRGLLDPLRRAREPGAARHRPPRLLRRGPRRRPVRPARRRRAPALPARTEGALQVLAATDPANPYGASLAWPKLEGSAGPPAPPAPTSCCATASRSSTSSGAARGILRLMELEGGELGRGDGGARRGRLRQARSRSSRSRSWTASR